MSKSDFEKNQREKEKQNKTAGSSKTVSNPTVTTTQSQTAKKTTQKSQPTYWQANQQTQNKQATQQARKELNISQPKTQAFTASQKRQIQADARSKRNKYAEAERKAKQYNAETSYDYSQANEGIKAMFTKGSASSAMNKYAHANQKALEQDRANRLGQAEISQAVVDTARHKIDSNRDVKAWSDMGLSMLGGLTNWVGGTMRLIPDYLRADAGFTGNQKLAESLAQVDRDLGLEEMQRNVNEGNIVADRLMGKVASSVGNMLPTIATNLITGGAMGLDPKLVEALGLGVMGASVLGNNTAQAFNNLQEDGELSRADTARALGYGLGSAGLEVATEKLSDLIPGLDTFAFTNPNHLLGQAGGEALEEMVSSAVEPWLNPLANQNLTNDNFGAQYAQNVNANTWTPEHFKDIAESGLLGAATSLAMGAPANITNAVNQLQQSQMTQEEFDEKLMQILDELLEKGELENIELKEPEQAEPVQVTPAEEQQTKPVEPEEEAPVFKLEEPELQTPDEEPEEETEMILPEEPEEWTPEEAEPAETTEEVKTTEEPEKKKANIKDLWSADQTSEKRAEVKSEISEEIKKRIKDDVADTEAITPEMESVSENIINDIDEAHQVLTKLPKNEAELGKLKESKSKKTEIRELLGNDDTYTAEKIKNSDDVALYKTISNENLLKSADAVFNDVGLDGMRDIILRPELLQNKGVSGMMISYCNKYAKEAKTVRDTFLNTNKLSEKDGVWYKDGKALSADDQLVKDLHDMDEKNWKVIEATFQYRSNAGYALQACKLMNEISPEIRLEKLDQWIKKLNADMHEYKGSRKYTPINRITDAEKSAYLNAKSDAERAAVLQSIEERVHNEMPAGFSERAAQWRYLMMLANPTTHMRNVIGNILMQGLTSGKNAITYAIERAFFQGRRFTSLLDLSNAGDANIKLYADNIPTKMVEGEFEEFKKAGLTKASRSEREAFWKKKGYSGELLNYLSRGTQAAMDNVTKERWAQSVANIIKQKGYNVSDKLKITDANGNVINDVERMKLFHEGFADSRRHYVDSSQFSRTNEEGKAVYANRVKDKALYDFAKQYFTDYASNNKARDAGKWNANFSKATDNVFEKTRFKFFNKTLGKGIDWVASKNNNLLDLEDKAFTQARFSAEFATQLKLNGYEVDNGVLKKNGKEVDMESDEVLRLQEYAYEEALESVFRDTNKLAKTLAKMRNWNGVYRFAIDSILPFTTTPFNIVRRISEYSPIGFTKGLYGTLYAVEAGKMSPQTAINKLARGTTGTGLLLLGAFLASIGKITGKKDKEDRADRYESSLGVSPEYAWQFADGSSYTLDWAAPAGAIMLLGATMHDRLNGLKFNKDADLTHNTQTVMDWMLSSGMTALDPVLDMTVLSGLQDLFEGYAQGDKKLEGVVENVIKNFVGQFTPTIGGKINKIVDDTKRTTYSDTWIDSVIRQNMNKIPMMSTLLEPALDYKGNNISNTVYDTGDETMNTALNAAYYMLSPGTYTTDKSTSYDKELLDIARKSGNEYIVPTSFTYLKDKNGEQFKFTPKERTELNRYYAQTYKAEIEKFMHSSSYGAYGDDKEGILAKSEVMDSIQKHIYNLTKEKYFSKVSPDSADVLYANDIAAEKMKDIGIDLYQFYEMKNIHGDKDSKGDTIAQSGAMKVRNYMENQGIYEDVLKAIQDEKIKPKDVNLTKTVIKMDADEYEEKYQKLLDDLAKQGVEQSEGEEKADNNKDKKKDDTASKKGGSSYSSRSYTSRSRASGGSSGSSSSGTDGIAAVLSALSRALSHSRNSASKIQTSIKSESSAQDLYNQIMSQHKTNLNNASKYTQA